MRFFIIFTKHKLLLPQMDKSEREKIIKLIRREVIPAIGCTEPMAVALCVAKATEILEKRPEQITVFFKC